MSALKRERSPWQHCLLVKHSNRRTISRQSQKQQISLPRQPQKISLNLSLAAFNETVVKSVTPFCSPRKFSKPLPFLGKNYRKVYKRRYELHLFAFRTYVYGTIISIFFKKTKSFKKTKKKTDIIKQTFILLPYLASFQYRKDIFLTDKNIKYACTGFHKI